METVVDLDPEAYEKARSLAAERGQSIGKVLSDALLGREVETSSAMDVEVDGDGWPVLRFGHPLTLEEAKTLVEED